MLYCFMLVRPWREAAPILPLPTKLPQTYSPIALQFCNTSTTSIILGFIHIISKPYNSPRLLNTRVVLFLICYSTFGLNKTKGNFLSAVNIAVQNSARHTMPVYFSAASLYWQVPRSQGKTHQIFFLLNHLGQVKVLEPSMQSPWSTLLSK